MWSMVTDRYRHERTERYYVSFGWLSVVNENPVLKYHSSTTTFFDGLLEEEKIQRCGAHQFLNNVLRNVELSHIFPYVRNNLLSINLSC